MLGSYMEDIGIKSDQFQKIFGGKEKRETNPAIHPFLFEQVSRPVAKGGIILADF